MTERELFIAALRQPGPAQRVAFLDQATAGDAGLRGRIAAMLADHDRLGSFLEQPAADLSAGPADGSTATSAGPRDGPGASIGPFRLVEVIGEGGMGTVYLAQQQVPVKRLVALKVIKPGMDSNQVLARFEAERQALALMDHPNIAKVLDAGATTAGRSYFVMELVKGVPITTYCDQRRLTPRQRLELFVDVCHAVQHAHQKGIIHRDLKPTNVLVAQYDGKPVPKVIDFGVSKATGAALTDKTLVTGFGTVVGTLEYMSPEQAEMNQLDVDTRSDIYSLGVLLFELLAGTTPLDRRRAQASGMLEALRIIREEEAPTPSNRLSSTDELPAIAASRGLEPAKLTRLVRGELDWIVMKALEKDRGRRYETANGFAADVERYLANEPVEACPPSAAYRLRKFVHRNRTGVLAASFVLLALVAGLVGTTAGLVRADHHWKRAEKSADEERQAKVREAEKHRLADERTQLAEANARRAVEEKRVADAVREFLQMKLLIHADVLTQADAILHGGGLAANADRDIKVRELLDRAAVELSPENIEKNFPNQSLVQAELLATIGATYYGVGETKTAIAFLERAIALARRHYGDVHTRTLGMQQYLAVAYDDTGNQREAVRLLEHASTALEERLGPDELDTLLAFHNLGTAYVRAGRLDEAVPMLERTHDALVRQFGPNSVRTLTTRLNLARARSLAGRVDDAVGMSEQVHRALEQHAGPDHPRTLCALSVLADAYRDAGKYKECTRLLEQARDARVQKLGAVHPVTLSTLRSLAMAYLIAGKLTDAVGLLEKVRDEQFKHPGPDDPDTLRTLNGLALAYDQVGKSREAIRLLETARDGLEKHLGPDHPDTLTTLSNLAGMYREDDKLEDAIRLLERVRDIRNEKLGADHPSALMTLESLAMALLRKGSVPEAVELFERVRSARERKPGPDHPDTLRALNGLAAAYQQANRRPEAIQLLERARDGLVRVLGPDHPDTLTTLGNLAEVYSNADRLPEGVQLYEQVHSAQERVLGPNHPKTLSTLSGLAFAHGAVRNPARNLPETIRLLERVRDAEEKVFGPDHPRTLETIHQLARASWIANQRTSAVRLFEQAASGRERALGRDHAKTLDSLTNLGVVYWTTDQLDKSIPLFEDLLKRQESKWTRDHPDTLRTIANLGINYRDAGRFDRAIALLDEAYRKAKSPKDAWAASELRITYIRAGKSAEAVRLIEEEVAAARKVHPPSSLQLAAALNKSAVHLIEANAYAAAEPIVRECLAIYETHPTGDLPRTAARSMLGTSLLGQRKYADAEPVLLQSVEELKRLDDPKSPARAVLNDVIARLVRLYEATGDKAQMAKWQAELEARKKVNGKKDPSDQKSK
jgi:serine/threonine protein kinase